MAADLHACIVAQKLQRLRRIEGLERFLLQLAPGSGAARRDDDGSGTAEQLPGSKGGQATQHGWAHQGSLRSQLVPLLQAVNCWATGRLGAQGVAPRSEAPDSWGAGGAWLA